MSSIKIFRQIGWCMYLVDQVEGADGGAAHWRVEQPVGGPRTQFGIRPSLLHPPHLRHIIFPCIHCNKEFLHIRISSFPNQGVSLHVMPINVIDTVNESI